MVDRTPLRLLLDELGNPAGLAEFRPDETIPVGYISGLAGDLSRIDALLQALVQSVGENTPPAGVEGQRFIVGTAPTGAWAGQANKLARFLDGAWQFFDARHVLNAADGFWYVRSASTWSSVTVVPADGSITNAKLADVPTLTIKGRATADAGDPEDLTASQARSVLELGTASTANVTTSATDTTAGRVMKVGDAGILGATPGYSDGNALPNGLGFYCWFMEGSASTNLPLGAAQNWQGFESGGANSNRGYTMAAALGVDRTAFRTRSAGVNGPWCENWHSRGTNAVVVDTGSFGYGTGSGGAVTQATSKATGVTLNKPSGQVTTAGDALAANSAVSFTLTNNKIAANDIPKVVIKSGATAGAYVVQVDAVAAGSCRISIRNMTAGSLSETLVLQFNIEKGAIA